MYRWALYLDSWRDRIIELQRLPLWYLSSSFRCDIMRQLFLGVLPSDCRCVDISKLCSLRCWHVFDSIGRSFLLFVPCWDIPGHCGRDCVHQLPERQLLLLAGPLGRVGRLQYGLLLSVDIF